MAPLAKVQDPLDTHNIVSSNFTHPRQPLTPFVHHPNTPPASPSQNRFQPLTSGHARSATASSSKHAPTPAEAYASAHQPRKIQVPAPVTVAKRAKEGPGARDGAVHHQPISTAMTGSSSGSGSGGGSKPIFEWISRKLGGNRRASIAEPSASARSGTMRAGQADETRSRYPSLPRNMRNPGMTTSGEKSLPGGNGVKGNAVAGPSTSTAPIPMRQSTTLTPSTAPMHLIPIPDHPRPRLTPSQIFPQTPARDSILSRSESHSLQSYSLFSASPTERDRRREANNPYPSMPIQMYRGSIMSSSASAWASTGQGDRSVSFRTRSRSPSVRSRGSISSSLRPRISISEERKEDDSTGPSGSLLGSGRGGLDAESDHRSRFSRTPGADENASIRPLPPSHPPSPTPSQSLLTRSRSASTSLLSPRPSRPRSPTSPYRPRIARQHSESSIGVSQGSEVYDDSIAQGRQSRRDSTSTQPTTIVSVEDGQIGHIAQVPLAGAVAPTLAPIAAAAPSTGGLSQSPVAAIAPIAPPIINPTASTADVSLNSGTSPVDDQPIQQYSAPNTPSSHGIETPMPASPILFTAPTSPLLSSPQNLLTSDTQIEANTAGGNHDSAPAAAHTAFQAQPPKHTLPHPMHNPRPSSPPDDNASTLTLASSTFAYPPPVTPVGLGHTAAGSIHRPTSVSRLSIISNPGSSTLSPGTAMGRGVNTPGPSISPTVTFAPIPSSDPPYPHRPTSIAPSHLSSEYPARPPSLASPLTDTPKEYAPTLGTKGSTHTWGWMSRYGVDEKASTRAVRRKGSEGSVGSFESRWSWAQPTQPGGVGSPGAGVRRISDLGGSGLEAEERRSGSLVR